MHAVTRVAIAACAVLLAAGAALAMSRAMVIVPAAPVPRAAGASVDPALTQRKGEWSVVCPKTGNPLVDFSPVDRGQTLNRLVLTVHNCSTKPVKLTKPVVWLGGKESQTEHLLLDTKRTNLSTLTLQPYESAQAIFSWEPPMDAEGDVLSVDFPGIGQGEIREPLALSLTTRAWISGWTQ